jgi:hypothetical protein
MSNLYSYKKGGKKPVKEWVEEGEKPVSRSPVYKKGNTTTTPKEKAIFHNETLDKEELDAYKQAFGANPMIPILSSSRTPTRNPTRTSSRTRTSKGGARAKKYNRGTYKKRKKLPVSGSWFGLYAQTQN